MRTGNSNTRAFMLLKLALTGIVVVPMLVACSGPSDVKLSEMNEPKNAQKLLEALTGEERQLLRTYVVTHTASGDLDYNKTVKQAIEAQKAEIASADKARANVNQIK